MVDKNQAHTDYSIECQVAVIGAGIAGLWLAGELKQKGISFVLLESHEVGGVQTLASQGIIHGGTKYALKGQLTGSAQAIAEMPVVWQACLEGRGVLDLTSTKINSYHHYLWSYGRYTGALKSFVSSKVLNSDSVVLADKDYPELFKREKLIGSICALNEVVLDTKSLVETLFHQVASETYKIPFDACYHFREKGLESIQWQQVDGARVCVKAQQFVVTAGEGAKALLKKLPVGVQEIKMQTRPLKMVWIKFPLDANIPDAFCHAVQKGTKPLFTITTHRTVQGRKVWYVGGDLAESGIDYSDEEQIARTQRALLKCFSWLDFLNCECGVVNINRAERAMPQLKRPELYSLEQVKNLFVCWPTKLTFAPALTRELLERMNLSAASSPVLPLPLLRPAMGSYPWDAIKST